MSNIYIQEPPTSGKVLLETTVGDIDVELWSREAPKACRNFIQLCMEGYYNGTIFHRMVKGFIVQGGDPTGTGTGGKSVWEKTFKDEFHSRLRFTRRGLLAMANAGKDDNGSQFFFTLAPTPELQNKHTVFGKVSGNTIYNMIKLEEGTVDEDEKPHYPHKILATKILNNPFEDIVPRQVIKKSKTEKNSQQVNATKNFKLLSFGEEAEEAEEEDSESNKIFSRKGKSSHDLTNDPKLSTELALEATARGPSEEDQEEDKANQLTVESVREKLKSNKEKEKFKRPKSPKSSSMSKSKDRETNEGEEEEEEEYYLGKAEKEEKQKKLQSLKEEFKSLKREMLKKEVEKVNEEEKKQNEDRERAEKLAEENNLVKEFLDDQKKYKEMKIELKTQGEFREAKTLALLAKFQKKIEVAKQTYGSAEAPKGTSEEGVEEVQEQEGDGDDSWLAQTLHYDQEKDPVLAKDANLKSDDWFEIYDPRNPLNKRRRGEESSSSSSAKEKRSKT